MPTTSPVRLVRPYKDADWYGSVKRGSDVVLPLRVSSLSGTASSRLCVETTRSQMGFPSVAVNQRGRVERTCPYQFPVNRHLFFAFLLGGAPRYTTVTRFRPTDRLSQAAEISHCGQGDSWSGARSIHRAKHLARQVPTDRCCPLGLVSIHPNRPFRVGRSDAGFLSIV